MKKEDLDRLKEILNRRKEREKDFESNFMIFSRNYIREEVGKINDQLEKSGFSDQLKIFYEDPFNLVSAKYLVQIFYRFNKTSNTPPNFQINSDNYNIFDASIKFIGRPDNNTILAEYKLANRSEFTELGVFSVSDLDNERISSILVDFISRVLG